MHATFHGLLTLVHKYLVSYNYTSKMEYCLTNIDCANYPFSSAIK